MRDDRDLPPVEDRIAYIIGLNKLQASRLLPAIEACGYELVPKRGPKTTINEEPQHLPQGLTVVDRLSGPR